MKIGIISALSAEQESVIARMSDKKETVYVGNTYTSGKYAKHEIISVASGAGKVSAAITAQILIDKFGVDRVIFSGTGGGMKAGQHIGDVIIVSESAYHDTEMYWLINYYPFVKGDFFKSDEEMVELAKQVRAEGITVKSGVAVTGDTFIVDDGRERICEKFSPDSVDMETAGAAQACFMNNIPFMAVRGLSDTEDDKGRGTFEVNCAFAAKNAAQIVFGMIDML